MEYVYKNGHSGKKNGAHKNGKNGWTPLSPRKQPRNYTNAWDCFMNILHTEGPPGLYRGLRAALIGEKKKRTTTIQQILKKKNIKFFFFRYKKMINYLPHPGALSCQ